MLFAAYLVGFGGMLGYSLGARDTYDRMAARTAPSPILTSNALIDPVLPGTEPW